MFTRGFGGTIASPTWVDLVADLVAGFAIAALLVAMVAVGDYSGAVGVVIGFLFGVGWGLRQPQGKSDGKRWRSRPNSG